MKNLKFSSLKLGLSVLLIFVSNTQLNSQWVSQNSGVSSQLLSVYFINQETGFACGVNGKVLKTINSGANWQANTVYDTLVSFMSLHFVNSLTGFMAGGILVYDSAIFIAKPIIVKTTNQGNTWNSVLNDSFYILNSVYFINENTGFATGGLYIAGNNHLLCTTNGGTDWQLGTLYAPGPLITVSFYDMNTGFILNYHGHIYKTNNSGQNWNHLTYMASQLYSIFFINSDFGFLAGGNDDDSSGFIYNTVNGGSNWNLVYSDTLGMINQLKFVNSNTGFAVGHNEYWPPHIFSARIIKTTNSGNNWFIDTIFNNIRGLSSLYFTSENTGYAVGSNGTILKTTTGGNPIGISPIAGKLPDEFFLSQNYPNPFNPTTKIKFSIPPSKAYGLVERDRGMTQLIVYDILGREITTLVNEQLKPGTYEVEWDGGNYPSGAYFYKLIVTDASAPLSITKKMVLIK
jgi:photosystem II stability/assembly factor-like uncharacterized protein